MRKLWLVPFLALAALATACGTGDINAGGVAQVPPGSTGTPGAVTPAPEITPFPPATPPGPITEPTAVSGMPPEVEESLDQWPLPQRDYASTRSTSSSGIDSDTVDELGLAWSFEVPGRGAFGALATNPIVVNDTVYLQDLGSNVFAIDLESGEVLWEQRFEESSIGPNGVAVGWGKVFAAISTKEFAALDAETGEEVWTADLDLADSEGIDIQPIVYDDLVFMSTVPGSSVQDFYAGNATGKAYALDQETGEIVWQFDTVESDDLWGHPEINSGGGAWYPPSIDTERGMTYWGIGNPAPYPGTPEYPNGTSRPGPNLYTNSVIALDHESGELEWYQQVKPHDIFDHDFQNSPILTSAAVSGRELDLAIGAGKDGTVVAMNREDGNVVWETPVGEHQNDHLAAIPEGETLDILPGVYGGVETPMAYAAGIVYVPIVNLATPFSPGSSGETNFEEATGELVAIEVETGRILWKRDLPHMALGGATVVNDLVFTALYDGRIYAFNRATGEEVWSYQAPIGINAQPAVAGDTILWPAGVQQGEQAPALLAMRVGADEPLPTPAPDVMATPEPGTATPMPGTPTPSPTPPVPGEGGPTGDIPTMTPTPTSNGTQTDDSLAAQGEQLVQSQGCLGCHSTGGGAMIGPTFQGLYGSQETLQDGSTVQADDAYLRESIVEPNAKVAQGFPSGVMPQGYGSRFSDQEIDAIVEYLKTLQ
ncbi:MAG: PQQ-binding-like beta-propeller repeat protein [Dehalococcoidia bacterium]